MPPPEIRKGTEPLLPAMEYVLAFFFRGTINRGGGAGKARRANRKSPPVLTIGRLSRRGRPRKAAGGTVSDYFLTWPRISPALLASVWILKYQRPAIRSAACASVSALEPSNGLLAVGPWNTGTTTPAFLPGSAGPWKCAAVAGPVRPE